MNLDKHSFFCAVNILILLKLDVKIIEAKRKISNLLRWECTTKKPISFIDISHNLGAFFHLKKKIYKKNRECIICIQTLENKYTKPIKYTFSRCGYTWFIVQKAQYFVIERQNNMYNGEITFILQKNIYVPELTKKLSKFTTQVFYIGSFYLAEKMLEVKFSKKYHSSM